MTQARSSVASPGAFVLTDSMPFLAPAFDECLSLVAMISPLPAFNPQRNFPALSV